MRYLKEMTRSMTAYGRGHAGPYLVEIHSVNRKGLELNIYLPRELLCFDMDIRKILKQFLKRGSVSVRLTRDKHAANLALPKANELKAVKDHFDNLAKELKLSGDEIDLPFLCNQLQAVGIEESPQVEKSEIEKGVLDAAQALISMKEQEGRTLLEDISKRSKSLAQDVESVAKHAKIAPEVLRQKLSEKLKALEVDQEGIAKEVVLFAEKSDITEELVRLRSHLRQLEGLLGSDEISVGRTLDFLLIEMGRELNTIAAKSFQLEITDQVPLMKAEVEKIREQAQNIE